MSTTQIPAPASTYRYVYACCFKHRADADFCPVHDNCPACANYIPGLTSTDKWCPEHAPTTAAR